MKSETHIQPFPNIAWYRPSGEIPQPGDLPTATSTVLLDPLEKAIMADESLQRVIEASELTLPARSMETEPLARVYGVVGFFLIAKRSAERYQARKAVDKLLSSELDSYLLVQLIDAQTHLPAQLTELKLKVDEVTKPPTNFRIRGIFQPHALESVLGADLLRQQILSAGHQNFGKNDDNLFFLEDAYGDYFKNPDFYEAFAAYNSVQKAVCFTDERSHGHIPSPLSSLNSRQRPVVDELIDLQVNAWTTISESPQYNPEKAYQWHLFMTIDKLINEGYPVSIVWENGPMKGKFPRLGDNPTPEETLKIARSQLKVLQQRTDGSSDRLIAQQLIDLEKNRNKDQQTNVIMVFGPTHAVSINLLPQRLQTVTRVSVRN